jgi:hypothetical protein
MMRHLTIFAAALSLLAVPASVHAAKKPAHVPHVHKGGIVVAATPATPAPFDIVHAKIKTEGNVAVFHMAVSGKAGKCRPIATGKFAASSVFSYVWPTSIDPYEVGFERGAGILALAVTSHPDFDDTPLFDENKDGKRANDGDLWHMHWVVLGPDKSCGPAALKVIDIAKDQRPRLPKTWPGVPILLDSPGWQPSLDHETVEVRVPFDDIGIVERASFDGVTAGLRINASAHAPLLCVADVFKIASGTLSLPGKTNQ